MNTQTARRLYWARCVVAVLTVLLLTATVVVYSSGAPNRAFANLGMATSFYFGAINCFLAASASSGRLRLAWAGLAGASLSWAIGQSIWSWYELVLQAEVPFPGLSDVGFLGFPLFAVFGIAVFPANVSQSDRRRMALDGLMTACAIGIVSWATALGAVVSAGGPSFVETAISVAYPLSDVALLVVCVLVLSQSRTQSLSLAFIAAGLALMAVADSGFAYRVATGEYATGDLIDLGWFFAPALLVFATLTRGATSAVAQRQTTSIGGTLLPYLPLGAAVAVFAWQYSRDSLSVVETMLAVMIVLLVLLRQFLTVRDNRNLAVALAEREGQLRHQVFHDPLTGLANRALFVDRVAHALELHARDRRPLAICFLDLDGFKLVNDSLGHSAGDDVLRQVADRFKSALTEADTLARFGGDEFAVLLEDQHDPVAVGEALLASLRAPFIVSGRELMVLASIGVARVDPVGPSPSVDELLARADLAMYVVKSRGKSDVLLHTTELRLENVDHAAIARALVVALASRELTLDFQPIVDLSTGRLDTLEALARWAPGGRPLSPEIFVRVADDINVIEPLFHYVLSAACESLAQWSRLPGGSDVRVAVNISPGLLSSPRLPKLVAAELARHRLSGDRLILEISAVGPLTDTIVSQSICQELQGMGVRLSVDDFGTGPNSLARLRDLPIDEVKIDRSFIAEVDNKAAHRRFVSGVLAFATQIGLSVVAEGVEREAEREALADLGCHRAQGFLFSPPVVADAVPALLQDRATWHRPTTVGSLSVEGPVG